MPGQAARTLRIAVLDDFQNVAKKMGDWSSIPNAEVVAFADHVDAPDALVERLAEFDVVCLMRERTPMAQPVLSRLPRLKLVCTTGMWNARLDIACALREGLTVCGTDSVKSGTPELTWLLILALARKLPAELTSMACGGWQTSLGQDLEGSTIGILGLGTIGGRVARVANALGMRVLAWSQNLTAESASAAGATLVGKDELLRSADFVTIHLKLSARTRGLIGARELELMKPTAFLVNTSRGFIVDQLALLEALRSGRIAGAGLDVYDIEPLPGEHPLRKLPNVIATPHIGYVTQRQYRLFFTQVVENIRAWTAGAPVRTLHADGPAMSLYYD